MLTHGAVASRYLGKDVVYEAFADWTKARVRLEVKATLGMLAKLTVQPLEFGVDDENRKTMLGSWLCPKSLRMQKCIARL